MIGCLDVFQVQLDFFMFDDMLYHAIMQGPEFSSEMQYYFSRLLVLFAATVLQPFTVTRDGGLVPVPVHPPPKYYPDAAQHASSTCFCTGSGIYVRELLRFASVHGMSSPSSHFPRDPMSGPRQLQIIIVHWTCSHVHWNPSGTCRDLRCVLQLLP
jgi:hypothetical protein